MNNKYKIYYSDRETEEASSKEQALHRVRVEAQVNRLVTVSVPDGIYCYLSQEAKYHDDTGEGAYAVIFLAEQD